VLNQIAYTDLVPVIDGGISIDVFEDGNGMRTATWRSHVIRPGRPCLVCNEQVDLSDVSLDIQGLLDDPTYIAGAGRQSHKTGQNVALLSVSAAASVLAQFVSLNVAPGGLGDPGPLQYLLSTHTLEHLAADSSRPNCPFEHAESAGDERQPLTGDHPAAEAQRANRASAGAGGFTRIRGAKRPTGDERGGCERPDLPVTQAQTVHVDHARTDGAGVGVSGVL
jgi:hypothetical protein